MKKFLSFALILLLMATPICICICIVMTGCTELTNTEYEIVQVKIVDEYHRGYYATPVRVGKVTTMISHPATYHIYVEYDGVKYRISGRDVWEKHKDMAGETVSATLETRTYDDGSIRRNIVNIGVEVPNDRNP